MLVIIQDRGMDVFVTKLNYKGSIMKTLLTIFLSIGLLACGGSERTETDVTDGNEQNVSREQTISEEEQQKKDSTSLDLVGEDTTKSDY